jgi:Na+/proline symporter
VFLGSAFQVNVSTTILVIGVVCTVVALLGGQWAMAASAFVQGLIMYLVIFVLVYFSLNLPEIGGPANLLHALPARHLRFDIGARFGIVWIWVGWSLILSFIGPLDLRNAGRFISVKDDRNARIMVLMMTIPGLLGLPILMQLPSMCAATVFPDLHALFPNLRNPEEAAYVAMAFKVLPQGLMGVMICGMLAASMDLPLNYFAGIAVRNIYIRFIRPEATDRQQLWVGRAATIGFGVVMIACGMAVDALRTINLFDFFQLFNAMAMPPMMVPMVLGLLIRRTPSWSGWSTVLVGLLAGVAAKAAFAPELIQHWLNYATPLTVRETIDSQFVFVSVATFVVSTAWFLGTMPFYRYSRPSSRARVESLFADYHRPIDRAHGEGRDQDAMQYRVVGRLSMILGGFMLVCMLIPNPLRGRLAFLFIGGVCFLLGLWMERIGRRKVMLAARGATSAPGLP